MDDSFELLSSMSPKLKGRQKTVKKAIKILALKKHIRRSSVYDKGPAVRNEDLAIVESSTLSSKNSLNFLESVGKKSNSNKNNVVIIDSTDSENDDHLPLSKSKKLSSELLRNCDKTETKDDRIQAWLNNLEVSEQKDNLTFFSQVSTIYGDEAPKFDPDGKGLAASSTFNEGLIKRFDELFVSDNTGFKNKPSTDITSDDSLSIEMNTSLRTKLKGKSQTDKTNNLGGNKSEGLNRCNNSMDIKKGTDNLERLNNIIIDETLLTSDESIVNQSNDFESPILRPKLCPYATPERPLTTILGEHITTRKKKEKIIPELKDSSLSTSLEMETMLDSLYSVKWREKQNHVVPMSEPRKKVATKNGKKILAPNTERILKPSTKDNKQSMDNRATQKLNFAKLKTPVASPWMERLKGLVDSDTNIENINEKDTGIDKVKTRLNFCEDSPIIKPSNVRSDNKESFDDSYLGESLEERIRKKMNNFKVPNKDRIKNGGQSKKSNKEYNVNIENKGNKKTLQNENKEKPVFDKDSKKTVIKGANKRTVKNTTDNLKKSKSTSSSNSCSEIEISSDEEYDKEITRMYEVKSKSVMPLKERRYSFLESLSASVPLEKSDMAARIFRTSFKHYRDQLTKKLFLLYNEKVFGNAIPGDTEIEWNDKLRNTAGLCYCKKITHRDGNVVRKVRIALSSKVLDSPDRLRDTLIHEMCHASTWIVNQVSNGHGIYWKNWAFKAMKVFPELPPIKRCHTYQINTKYTYKCTGCGYSVGRHSKSLNTDRKRCGLCHGKFELLINKTYKSGETKAVPVTPRKQATPFSIFVKENYARYKEPSKKHGDVMKILGQKFSELKVKNDT